MRLTVGQLKNVICEVDQVDDFVLDVYHEILEAMRDEAGPENVRLGAGTPLGPMIIVDSDVPSVLETSKIVQGLLVMLCGEIPKLKTPPEGSKWHNKGFSFETTSITVKLETYTYAGKGKFDILVWQKDSMKEGLHEAASENHNYVEEVYPEIKLALEEIGGEEYVEVGQRTLYHRGSPQLVVHNPGMTTKEITEVLKGIVELVTASKAHVNRSGKVTCSYEIVVPGCVHVKISQISAVDIRVYVFESYMPTG